MLHFPARLSASASSHHDLSLAAFITNIAKSNFRYTQVFTQEIIRAEAGKLIIEVMGRALLIVHQETDAKFAALEAQITGLRNAMSEFCYRGLWVENKQYKRGNFVTLGSVWHAAVDTRSKPGTDSDWTLVIAKPRDGKDSCPSRHQSRAQYGACADDHAHRGEAGT